MLIEDPKITNNVAILELKGLKPVENMLNYDVSRWPRLTTVWIGRTSYDCNLGQCYVHQESTTTRYEDDNDENAIILTDVGITLISCICAVLCGGVFYASRQYIMRVCSCCKRHFRGGITLGGISFGENNTDNNLIELSDNQVSSSAPCGSSTNPPNAPCDSSTNPPNDNKTNPPVSNTLLHPPSGSSTPICYPITVPPRAPKKPPKPSFIIEDDRTPSFISSGNVQATPKPKNSKPWPRTSTLSASGLLNQTTDRLKYDTHSTLDSGIEMRQPESFSHFHSKTPRRPSRRNRRSFDDIDEYGTYYC